jgi:hypothetical protein
MRRAITMTLLACLALALPALAADDALPLEQQLFNDFAARLQEHLHKSAALLEKIRQSSDAQQRGKLMKDYQQNMRTTMKINHLMHQVTGDDAAMGMKKGGGMMKGKKMGGGMSCCSMVMGKKDGKKSAAAGGEASSTADDAAGGAEAVEEQQGQQEEDAAGGEHEGH